LLALGAIPVYTGSTTDQSSVAYLHWDWAMWRQEMLKKFPVVAILLSVSSFAAAATVSIGTASARGDIRIDSYMVKGNATLFDGSVVETGQATADLRLDKGTQITMATSSRGTLYRDRLVLQQGESELAASSSFQLEANGLHVTPNTPNSRGVVSLKAGNTVEVEALNGGFGVTNDHGVLLAHVPSGHAVFFAMQEGEGPTEYSGVGTISYASGHYYLTDNAGQKYEITCKDFKKYVGKEVKLSGTVQAAATPTMDATSVVCGRSVAMNSETGMSTTGKLIVSGVVVYTAAGLGVVIDAANQPSTPASR
jgi:hypothetical protein